MIDCDESSKLISESMDRPLAWGEKFALWLHLAACDLCRAYRQHLGLLRAWAARWLGESRNATLSDEAKSRLKTHLKSAGS